MTLLDTEISCSLILKRRAPLITSYDSIEDISPANLLTLLLKVGVVESTVSSIRTTLLCRTGRIAEKTAIRSLMPAIYALRLAKLCGSIPTRALILLVSSITVFEISLQRSMRLR